MSELIMWTIYDHPRDFPNSFVARKWNIVAGLLSPVPTDNVIVAPSLEHIRSRMAKQGFHRIERHPTDDPHIIEVWL